MFFPPYRPSTTTVDTDLWKGSPRDNLWTVSGPYNGFSSVGFGSVGAARTVSPNKLVLTVPGAEGVKVTRRGTNRLHVEVTFPEDRVSNYEYDIPEEYAASTPTAVYKRGILTITWPEPEENVVQVEFQE